MTSIEVIAPGALTTVQDLGRPGWGYIGIPRSGAADRPAMKRANRLVGNDDGAAVLETTLAGPRLRFAGEAELALTGAPVNARLGDRRIAMNDAFTVAGGDELGIGNASSGLRTYVAFRGGLDVPLTLGSAATDLLTGLGPKPLERGDVLALRRPLRRGDVLALRTTLERGDVLALRTTLERGDVLAPRTGAGGGRTIHPPAPEPPPLRELPKSVVLRVIVGPRSDWFDDVSIRRLLNEPFTIGQASNRIGVRLHGAEMVRVRGGELRSEGLVAGAIQVPTDGRPIMLFVDHPTTGGYPVIAVVRSDDLPLVAQLRPGQQIRFAADGIS